MYKEAQREAQLMHHCPRKERDPTKHKRETSRDPKSLKIKETENQKTSLKNQSIPK